MRRSRRRDGAGKLAVGGKFDGIAGANRYGTSTGVVKPQANVSNPGWNHAFVFELPLVISQPYQRARATVIQIDVQLIATHLYGPGAGLAARARPESAYDHVARGRRQSHLAVRLAVNPPRLLKSTRYSPPAVAVTTMLYAP